MNQPPDVLSALHRSLPAGESSAAPIPARIRATAGADARGLTLRKLAALFAVLFLGGHLLLPPTLDDIDSVNFGLGIREFGLRYHQPHAPGYPVFIVLGKLAALITDTVEKDAPDVTREAHALSAIAVLFGALGAFPLLGLFMAIEDDRRRAIAATAVTLASPLYWFSASRPMSDAAGLTAALVAIALLAVAYRRQRQTADSAVPQTYDASVATQIASGRLIVAGALAAGIAIGFRSQNLWLTLPLLAIVIVDRVGRGAAGALLGGAMTFSIGVLLWAVPLVITTGGTIEYLDVLRLQRFDDIGGVDMLFRSPSARRLALGLHQTLVLPWGNTVLAVAVLGLAVIGIAAMVVRARSGLLLLATAIGVYFGFHIVFHETVTLRYALPFMPALAYLAVAGADTLTRRLMPLSGLALVVWCLAVSVPAARAYTSGPSPVFQAAAEMRDRASATGGSGVVIGMHHDVSRALRGEHLGAPLLPAPAGLEWLELAKYWREGGEKPVWFLGNPDRADLAFVDPASRSLQRAYRWPPLSQGFLRGVRPKNVDWHSISPPGWFTGEGWALTPELAGGALRSGSGPARGAIEAFVRRRNDPSLLMIGGRNLAGLDEPAARFQLSLDGRTIDAWMASSEPRFFLRFVDLPAGSLSGSDRYARLRVWSEAADGSSRFVNTAIEQFDLQPLTSLIWGFDVGWHEQEYDPASGRSWRWSSASADLRVRHPGAVRIRIAGESPLESFSGPSHIGVRAGTEVLATAIPREDFQLDVTVPAAALASAGGVVTLQTDQVFVPADRSSSLDRRPLGLRIYRVEITPASAPDRAPSSRSAYRQP